VRNHDHKTDKFQLFALIAIFGMTFSCDKKSKETDLPKENQRPQTSRDLQEDKMPKSGNSEEPANKKEPANKEESASSLVPQLRENIGVELPQIQLHPEVKKSRDEIGSELSALLNDKEKSGKYVIKKWSELTSFLPRTPLSSSNVSAISDGLILPPECLEVFRDSATYTELVLAGKHLAFTEPAEIRASAGILSLGTGLGDMLPSLLLKHSNDLPPTESDIAIFAAIVTSISDSPPNMTSIDEWRNLAKSKNPIYRLIAIKAAGQGSWNENRTDGILGFTTLYEKETDPQILSNLAQILATVPSLEARRRLELLSSIAASSNNDLLKEDVSQALRGNDLILPNASK
jgi:hypothetical protein